MERANRPSQLFVVMILLIGALRVLGQGGGSGSLLGQVTDPSGAAIPGATVTVTDGSPSSRTTTTDHEGRYRFEDLLPGTRTIRISSAGFAELEISQVAVPAGRTQTLNARLQIQGQTERITVSSGAAQVDVDPSRNGGQIVLRESDLDALSDDAEDLAKDLQALAGPSPGSQGPEFFIDGFTGGRLPPKASIREVRVNQNPFSSEYDRVGFGRIEVSTKPGSDNYHGQASFDFANRALTARNPYLVGPIVPDYQQVIYAGNISGPLSRKSSFFLDTERRVIDENSLLNYTALDAALNPVGVNGAVVAPNRRFNISPRVDYALTSNNTLALRYSWLETSGKNQGISTQAFDQPSQGYNLDTAQQNVQITDSAVLGSRALNDTRFQFLRTRSDQTGVNTAPEIDVQGAFTGGGTFPLNYTGRNQFEFQNYTTVLRGSHTFKFGLRLRDDRLTQHMTSNFNGRFIFSAISGAAGAQAIDIYRQNQLLSSEGVSQAAIAAEGFGPSEFLVTAGIPGAGVNLFDAGLFIQDDWKIRPNLTLSGGLRYEVQNGISDRGDFGPRAGLAWAPGRRNGTPKTVVRVGGGIFYDRFTSDLNIKATQLNGINQTQYIFRNPDFFPVVPDSATLTALWLQQPAGITRAIWQLDPRLRAPYMIQAAAGVERQLPHNVTLAVNYERSRGVRQLRARDVNAPLPVVFDNSGQAAGPRPYGAAAGDIYQYESSGVFNQNQVIVSINARVNRKLTLFGYYVYSRAMSDTDGPGIFPANPYDLSSEYSRAAFDARHRAFISGTWTAPFGVRLAPFVYLQSGLPYNMTSGRDINSDGNPNDDRPAFAQDLSRPDVIVKPGFGAFDTAPAGLPNAVLVPRNYLEGPGILLVTARVSRSWTFGETGRGGGNTGSDEIRGGQAIGGGGLSGGSSRAGLASVFGGAATARRYNLTASITFRNLLNNVNPATPIGNLSSPRFGRSVALSTYGPLPGVGPNAGAGNRHIELQLRFTF